MVLHVYNPTNVGGRARKTIVLGWPRQKNDKLSLKNSYSKRAGGIAKVIMQLPHKHKALSLNPSTTK
jgi:hypothetical protein